MKQKLKSTIVFCLWILHLFQVCTKADDGLEITESTTVQSSTTQEPSSSSSSPTSTSNPTSQSTVSSILTHPSYMQCNYHPGYINMSQCPAPLQCLSDGKCGCYEGIFSEYRFNIEHKYLCQIPAGRDGCKKSKDCTDYAHCWHPNKRNAPNVCHCCEGPQEGDNNGVCPTQVSIRCGPNKDPNDRNTARGNDYGSLQTVFAVFLTSIISIYIIK